MLCYQCNKNGLYKAAMTNDSCALNVLSMKIKHETPRSVNHKATQNKNDTGTTVLERSVA